MAMMKSIVTLAGVVTLVLTGPSSAASDEPFVFLTPVEQAGSQGIGVAWWLRPYTARPMGVAVAGTPLATVNAYRTIEERADWCWAETLSQRSYASLSRDIQAEIAETMKTHDPSFRVTGSLTGSGLQEAAVGFFEDCHGEQGVFLLVADPAAAEVLHLETWTDWPSSVIWLTPGAEGGLEFGSCFECGHAEALFYDQRRRRFYRESIGD